MFNAQNEFEADCNTDTPKSYQHIKSNYVETNSNLTQCCKVYVCICGLLGKMSLIWFTSEFISVPSFSKHPVQGIKKRNAYKCWLSCIIDSLPYQDHERPCPFKCTVRNHITKSSYFEIEWIFIKGLQIFPIYSWRSSLNVIWK